MADEQDVGNDGLPPLKAFHQMTPPPPPPPLKAPLDMAEWQMLYDHGLAPPLEDLS